MDIKFTKPYTTSWGGRVIDFHYKDKLVECYFDDTGRIRLTDVRDIDPTLSVEQDTARYESIINDRYSSMLVSKNTAKMQRARASAECHWWNTLPQDVKLELCNRLAPALIGIVDELLTHNPNDIKRRHYESLIRRSQIQTMNVTRQMDSLKLKKLPRYNATTNKLTGTPRSFIALAEACYPPMLRIGRKEV